MIPKNITEGDGDLTLYEKKEHFISSIIL